MASTSSASSAEVSLSERSKSVPAGWRAAAATISSTPVRPSLRAAWSQSLPGLVTRALSRSRSTPGVGLQEHVQDVLARVGQAAEDLGPVGVADQRHRDDERVRVVPAQRQCRCDGQSPASSAGAGNR